MATELPYRSLRLYNGKISLFAGASDVFFALKIEEKGSVKYVDLQSFRPDVRDILQPKRIYAAKIENDEINPNIVRKIFLLNKDQPFINVR